MKDVTERKVLLRGVVVVAQKGLGVAPDGVAECAPNVFTFSQRRTSVLCGIEQVGPAQVPKVFPSFHRVPLDDCF